MSSLFATSRDESDGVYVFKVSLDRRILDADDGTGSEQWTYDGPNITPIGAESYDAQDYVHELLGDIEIPDGVTRFILSFRLDGSRDYWGEYDEWVVDGSVKMIPIGGNV